MNCFLISARIAWRTLPESLGGTAAFVRVIAVPALTALFYLAIASGAGYTAVGLDDAVAAALGVGGVSASIAVAVLVAGDRFNGTLPFLIIASQNRILSSAGRFCVIAALGLVTAAVGLVAPLAIVGAPAALGGWMAIALSMLSTAAAAIGVGYVVGALSLRLRDSLALANAAEYVLPLFAGAVSPLSTMPTPLAWAASCLPLSHVIEAGRVGAENGLNDVFWQQLITGLGISLVWIVAAFMCWLWFERQARVRGTLDALAIG